MPYNRLQGLRGLQGLSGLSEQEKEAWYRNNADLLPNRNKIKPAAFDKIADRVYRNQLFAKEFKGSKDFNYEQLKGLSPETRDNLYKESLVSRNFLNSFSNDEDFNSLNKELDTQGKLDLLQSDYIGSIERKKHLKQGIKAAQKVAKDFDVAMSNPFLDIMGANYMQAGKAAANEYPQEVYESESNKDKELREKLYAETQKRREEENSEQSNALWQQWVQEDKMGKSKLSQYYNAFELMASNPKISPHYAAFKDSNWLKDYSYTDKIKDYAKYQVLKAQYGEGIANRYLDRSIQNRIAEAQDGKWTGNTLKGVLTTAWSDLGSNVALFAHAGDFLNAERMGIWNQGKDPDKPLDKDGNITYDPKKIVDYAKNDSWWTNPAYWNNVYKYNTFSPEEIKIIEERGGIAEDVNIREYGYTPDFFSWDTAEEGFKQGGHVVAGVVETGLTGGAGKAIGLGGKAILKGIGLSAKAMKTASKVGAITNDIMVTATTGLEGSQLEAMGTFDEQMQSAKEKIQDQINHELKQYQDSIDYNSKEARQAINGYFNELKKRDQRRVASVKGEGVKALPLSDETLKAQAKRIYESQLMGQKEKELETLHKKDMLEASKIAAQAYTANFIMDYIKNIPLTTAIQKYKIAKGCMREAFDNTIDRSIAGNAVTGGVRKAKNWASAKEIAKGFGKQIAGGFADEYLDGLHASFSGGMGSRMFNNYMNKNYNPEAYNAAADGMLGNMLAGVSEYMNGITSRQNLYEGFIGGAAPFTSGVISPHVIFTAHDTWNAVVKGVDGNGNRLNVGERMAQIISNPLLETYAELKDKDRRVNSTVEAINNVVAAHKEDLETASRLLYALKDNTALTTRVKISDEENAPTLLDSKDAKLYRAFTIMQALNTLGKIEGSSHAQLYNDAINTLQGLAEGTLSKEAMENEIDQFLAAKENKSILDLGAEKAREVVAERLQKNAQYFMDMKSKMDEIQSTMDKSSSMKNVDPRVKQMMLYNLVAQDDYKERLADIEKGLGVSQTNTQEMSTPNLSIRYGTEQSRTKAIEARERIDKDLVKQTEEIDKKIATADKEIERLKKSRYEKNNKEERQKEEEKLRQQETLKQSLQMQKEKVAEQRKKVEEEKKEIESLSKEGQEDRVLSEQEILQLNAQDRAFMLNEENLRNYSEKQQAVINHTKANLKQKDPDALNKIQDAGTLAERVSDIREMHEKLLNNDKLAAEYLNAAEDRRTKTAIAEALQDGINTHYKNLEESYQNREKNPEAVSKAAKATNARVLNAYIEDHPEQKEVYQPYLDLLKYEEDIAKVIGQSEYSDEEKVNLMGSMLVMHTLSNSREEAQKFLEDVIDNSEVAAEVKEQYNSLLQKLESLGYQRDAAVLRKRQEEAEKKKKKIEEAKKAEKEAKEKADIAAEEAKIEQVEGSSLEEVDLFEDEETPDSTEPTNLEDVDLFDEEDKVDVTDKSNTILWDRTTKETYFRNNKQGSNMSFFNEESSSKEEESKFRVHKNGNTGEFIPVDFMQIKSSDNAGSAVKISEGSVSWTEAQGYELVSPGKIHQEKLNGSKIWVIDKPAEIRLIKEQEVRLTSFNPNAVGQETKDSFTTDYQFDKEMSAYGIKGKLSKVVNGTAIYVDNNNQPVILLSAKGDHTFIGIFRESGSNRWSIKMENPTKDKDFKKMIASVMTQLPAYSEVYERTSISIDGLRVFAQQLQHGFVVGNDTYETSLNGADLANTFNLSQQEREDMSPVYAQEKDLESIRKTLRPYLEKFGVKDISKAVFINNEGKVRLRLPVLVKNSNISNESQTQQSKESKESTETPTSENSNLIEDGDEVYAKSSNLEEQAKEAEENNVSMSQTLPINNQAGVVENMEKNIPATLSGNAMSEYMAEPLVMDGELVHKRGRNPNDHMNQFYNWMAAAGVKLQNIIDDELHKILKNNPHARVKFMAVRPEYNATNDAALKTDLLLVLDYDDSKNKGITRIHNTDNGGVIESNGKKYLIIGVAGYGSLRNKTKQALYNNLFGNNPNSSTGYGLIKRGMKSFFDTHPSDRFYVNDDITTEIVPQSLIPGYRVRKLETDEEPQFRKVSELLSDEERNPSGIKFEELYWGIQEGGGFKVVGEVKEDEIMPPRNISRNVGSAFVLIPAGNGKWLPAYLKPLFYKEMQDGVLKTKVENLIQQVVAPSYNDRLIAVSALSQIFHFDKTGDTILLRKKSAVVSLVKDGIIFKTFTLDSNFNRQEFMEAIETMNPRVNVTLSGLGKKETVKEYNEAGALMTDLAKFGTAGSSFDIFAVNESGEMIEPVGSSESQATRTSNNSELKNNNRTQVIHNGRIYREADGIYYIGKTAVTDEGLKKQLDYLKKIIKEELLPSSAEGIYDYYTLSASRENPLIIKVNRSTKEVEELSAEESKKRLQKKWEEEDIRERATAASNKLAEEEHNPDKAEATNLEDVDLGLDLEDGIEIEVNREENGEGSKDGEMVKKDEKIETRKKEKEDRNERVDNKDEMSTRKIQKKNQGGKTISFSTLIKDKKWMLPVLQVIQKKWKDVPKDFSKMQDFLRSKGIEVDSIPSNAEDIQTWIKTIEECR